MPDIAEKPAETLRRTVDDVFCPHTLTCPFKTNKIYKFPIFFFLNKDTLR
jgi:hypothetical protein